MQHPAAHLGMNGARPVVGPCVERWRCVVGVVQESTVPTPRTEPDRRPAAVDPAEAEDFLQRFHTETAVDRRAAARRRRQVLGEIDRTGSYTHTGEELAYGARVAWRNAARCVGRLYWN